jgi:hypothetical protein
MYGRAMLLLTVYRFSKTWEVAGYGGSADWRPEAWVCLVQQVRNLNRSFARRLLGSVCMCVCGVARVHARRTALKPVLITLIVYRCSGSELAPLDRRSMSCGRHFALPVVVRS